jgi:FkbM family methyltransferase
MVVMPVKRRLSFLPILGLPLRVDLPRKRLRIWINSTGDLSAVAEVFAAGVYAHPMLASARTFLDAGSNIGAAALYFAYCSPNARVVCVEPSPRALRLLQRNAAQIEQADIVRAAIAEEDGEVVLHEMPDTQSSSLRPREGAIDSVTVPGRTLDAVLTDLGIEDLDVLKLDVEGAELEILRGFTGLERVGLILAEIHLDLMGGGFEELRTLLADFDVSVRPERRERLYLVARNRSLLRPSGQPDFRLHRRD